ncbi:uncharacterized protein ACRADG_007041 [Cochliomyia hominivorax]
MARDRLPELIQRSNSCNSTNGTSISIEQQNSAAKMQQNTNVDAILNPYSEIRTHLAQIAANLDSMNRMTQAANIRSFNENEMDQLRKHNLRLGNQLMTKFQEFKANLPAENDYTLEARMKRTLFYGLHQSYINMWTKNETFLQNYEQKLKKNLQMQSKIINCNATEEEIEELIANKTTSLFVGNILEETEKERKTLQDLMDRFNELKKLEKSIEEVHALFLRIQCLVMEQSETIQRVEFHAQQATLFVDKGADELEKADKLHKKALKKKVMLILIAIVVLLVLILIGLNYLTKFNHIKKINNNNNKMIRDRLPELKEVVCSFHASTESLVLIEMEETEEFVDRSPSPVMEALLKMYNEILLQFDQILENIEALKEMTQAKNSKQFDDRIFYKLRQNTEQIGSDVMNKFQSIKTILPPEDDYSALARMKRTLYFGLSEQFSIIWKKYDEFFQEHEHKLKKNLQMQAKILNYNLTEEEIDILVAHKFTTLYTGNILETEHARKTLQALKDRLGELRKLEKSIEEVHSLFMRLQNLVLDQGVMMQRIEKHFNDAREYVSAGVEDIKEAQNINKKTRKNKLILIIVAIIAVTLFLIILLTSITHKK